LNFKCKRKKFVFYKTKSLNNNFNGRKGAREVETKRWSESEVNKVLDNMLEQYENSKVIFLLYFNILQRYFKVEGVLNSPLSNLQSLHFCNAIEYPNFSFQFLCTAVYVCECFFSLIYTFDQKKCDLRVFYTKILRLHSRCDR